MHASDIGWVFISLVIYSFALLTCPWSHGPPLPLGSPESQCAPSSSAAFVEDPPDGTPEAVAGKVHVALGAKAIRSILILVDAAVVVLVFLRICGLFILK